jgi:hypothetical protein
MAAAVEDRGGVTANAGRRERAAAGRRLRSAVSRSSHAEWVEARLGFPIHDRRGADSKAANMPQSEAG